MTRKQAYRYGTKAAKPAAGFRSKRRARRAAARLALKGSN